jgi:hypothetical protein
MVTRYLQEVDKANRHSDNNGVDDLGSLLLGFLHFFGNRFDPRQTGFFCPYSVRETVNKLPLFPSSHS